jgi:hypothetical protein
MEKRVPHSPQKQNILGRKNYSCDANAKDWIEFNFNDCWRAIGRLHAMTLTLALGLLLVVCKITCKEKQ